MNNRRDFEKSNGPMTYDDFILIAQTFYTALCQLSANSSIDVVVTLYQELPCSSSVKQEPRKRSNEKSGKKMFAQILGLGNIPRGMFDLASSIQVMICPMGEAEHNTLYGSIEIECKGQLPHHVIFNMWPNKTAEKIGELFADKQYPSRFWFLQERGFRECSIFRA
ncbi:MAG: hypothetical protein ACYCZ7_00860 [Minisyncoccota bacterium]